VSARTSRQTSNGGASGPLRRAALVAVAPGPPRYTEKSDLELPAGASSVCAQLVFRDGETTSPHRFTSSGAETP